MNVRTLRIGNYIIDDQGLLSIVTGFQPYGHSIRCDEAEGCKVLVDIIEADGKLSKGFWTDSNDCRPIKLTDEHLYKFGFNLYPWGFVFNEFLITRWYAFRVGNGFNKELKDVHELQNLYFAMTGEDLIFKDFYKEPQ